MERIALANVRFPESPDDAVAIVERTVAEAGRAGVLIVCFPECYLPGYRGLGKVIPPPDAVFLEHAWARVSEAAAAAKVAVVLGTERLKGEALLATVLVIDRDGRRLGFQDKVQLDPSEDGVYTPGQGRQVFTVAGLRFGVAICHEGFRYPETVRQAVRQGAQLVFHPHFSVFEPGGYVASTFAEQGNTFHEKAVLCRAAENTCFFASVNCAGAGSPTTSAVAGPDGELLTFQSYGVEGLLVVDIDPDLATGLLASRLRQI